MRCEHEPRVVEFTPSSGRVTLLYCPQCASSTWLSGGQPVSGRRVLRAAADAYARDLASRR